jgi:hypothetical protein
VAVLSLLGRTDMCFEIPGEGGTGEGWGGAKGGGGHSMEVWGLKLGALGYNIVSGLRKEDGA